MLGGGTAAVEPRVSTGIPGLDRVLGGGLVPASVILLAGEPGIGKSTLLLQLLSRLAGDGRGCLLVSGEESHGQVAARSRRLGVAGDAVAFAPGRDLRAVLATARERDPFLLAVDSIQSVRDPSAPQMPGGVAQVRNCTDALVGMAKEEGIAVLMTGHVTKDGDLAGPRALEHAVDVVLLFEGDARSGSRVLSGGKNRFGAEGESAWFEMAPDGLHEIDPTGLLLEGVGVPGAAIALPMAGRRALAVEVQALMGSVDGPARRQTTGLDARRFQLMAAVLARAAGYRLGPGGAVRGHVGWAPGRRSGRRPRRRGRPRLGGDGGTHARRGRVRGGGLAHGARATGLRHAAAARRGRGRGLLTGLRGARSRDAAASALDPRAPRVRGAVVDAGQCRGNAAAGILNGPSDRSVAPPEHAGKCL